MSITLEECIKMLNSYAKSARNIAKDCLNKDGRHKLIKTAEKYEQEAEWLKELAERRKQLEIIYCGECVYYDPPHVENNGMRYEYAEMPKEAFDVLGTGLVSAEYGINIGGRCCVDYYCKNYSDDKRVYVPEDNYCGRAIRRTDD